MKTGGWKCHLFEESEIRVGIKKMKTLVKFMDNEDLVVSRHTALVSGSRFKPFSNVF